MFDLFRSKRTKANVSQEEHRRLAAAFYDLRTQVTNLDAQIATVHLALRRHEDDIATWKDLTDRNSKALSQLEQLVNTPSVQPPARHADLSVTRMVGTPARRLDLDRFSEQQKRLLGIFFQNRDRPTCRAPGVDGRARPDDVRVRDISLGTSLLSFAVLIPAGWIFCIAPCMPAL
jgi:hypothetical protein